MPRSNCCRAGESWALALVRSGIDVPEPILDRMAVFKNADLDAEIALAGAEGEVERRSGVERELARVKQILAAAEGVPKRGEETYSQRCAACHTLFGKGGRVGPDLTSYQRSDLDMLLLAVIAPGAEIREGFETTVIQTADGAVFTGFVADQDANVVVLRIRRADPHARPKANRKTNPAADLVDAGKAARRTR